MIHSMSESVIFAALSSGNVRRAVELILEAYQDELYGYCACLVGPRRAAELYQRILTIAVEQLRRYDGSCSMRAWLFGFARTMALAVIGRKASPLGTPTVEAALSEEIPGLRLRDELLEQAFGALPSVAREILELLLWHGLALPEAAHVVGRAEGQVRRLASEGLFALAVGLRRSSDAPS
jgi:RNA polymerase sigma factor (sigma-70 family)